MKHATTRGFAVLALALLLAACSSTNHAAPSARPEPGPTHPTCSGKAPAAQVPTSERLQFGGVDREYLVALPPSYDGRTAVPLVLQFHGFLGSGPKIEADTHLGSRGAAQGFAVVTPTSLGAPKQWNAFAAPGEADDFGFVAALVHHLEGELCINANRVFAVGHSNGAAFTGFLPCHVPHTFAAVAMASATIPPICPDKEQPSIYATAGTADPAVPARGGTVSGSGIHIPPAEKSIAAYRQAYRCAAEPRRSRPAPGVERESATGCARGRQVVYDEIEGGTHWWPGGTTARADPKESPAGKSYDATGAVLTFFRQVPSQS